MTIRNICLALIDRDSNQTYYAVSETLKMFHDENSGFMLSRWLPDCQNLISFRNQNRFKMSHFVA